MIGRWVLAAALSVDLLACGSSTADRDPVASEDTPTADGVDAADGADGTDGVDGTDGEDYPLPPENGMSAADLQVIMDDLSAVLETDLRTQATDPQTPEIYQEIAEALAKVAGVSSALYAGDPLGSVLITVDGGGELEWRHIQDDWRELEMMPESFDLSGLTDPELEPDYGGDDVLGWPVPGGGSAPRKADAAAPEENTYATRFPVASLGPDPTFAADDETGCPNGKMALVDFEWSYDIKESDIRVPGSVRPWFVIDGVPYFERLQRMAESAGYKVDVFKDEEINLGNFKKLEDYDIVVTVGHGSRPSLNIAEPTQRLDVSWKTHEKARTAAERESKTIDGTGLTYQDAWNHGFARFSVPSGFVVWKPQLMRRLYRPKVKQLWMQNQCWGMLPRMLAGYHDPTFAGSYWALMKDALAGKHDGVFSAVDNFGRGLRDAGVHVVLGYMTPATPQDIVVHSMQFFRRLWGGRFQYDAPPAPHTFWPTCMSAQTYFRPSDAPHLDVRTHKVLWHGVHPTIFNMLADKEPRWFRAECDRSANAHAYMQSQMLTFGTPSTQIESCWFGFWSKGNYPSDIENMWCSQGDNPTTVEASHDAACQVKTARRVTNAILSP